MNLDYKNIIDDASQPYLALILFGSYSRGDNSEFSDIDILQITLEKPLLPTYSKGKKNYSVYSLSDLIELGRKSSLFVLHIISEGTPISDSNKAIEILTKNFIYPISYDHFRIEINLASKFLSNTEIEYNLDRKGNYRLLIFLLRSLIYSRLFDLQKMTFSIDKAISILNDNKLAIIKKYKEYSKGLSFESFLETKSILRRYLNTSEPEGSREKIMQEFNANNSEMYFVITHFLEQAKQDYYS